MLALLAVLPLLQIDDMPVSHINWGSLQMNQSSTWREIHCVSFALKSFAHLLLGCNVKLFTDNQAVPSIVHSSSMKEHLHILVLNIFLTAKDNNIDIEVEWIPRTQNRRADCLSKIVDYDDWTVKDCYFHAVTSVWGPCSVNCFVSYKNRKVSGSIPSTLIQIPWVSIHLPLVGSAKHVALCHLFC